MSVGGNGHPETYRYFSRALDEVHTHIQELKIDMGVEIFKSPAGMKYPDSYLFTVTYLAPTLVLWDNIRVPIAVLTSDGMLHFLTGVSSVDLKVRKTKIPEALLGSDTL